MYFPAIGTIQIWAFFQVLARVSALVAIAPIFGARQVPNQLKVGLSVIFSLALSPIALPSIRAEGIPTSLYGFVAPLLMQVMIGILMGFIVSLVLSAVEMAGALLDIQVGFSMAQTFNPAMNELSAPLTQFQSLYALLLFLLAHGHYILINALAGSFNAVPAAAAHLGGNGFMTFFTDITFAVLVNALKIAAPAGAILVVIDFSFAMLARAVPQMNVFYVGMPLKVLSGLTLFAVILPLFAVFVGQMVADLPADLTKAFAGLRSL